MSAAGSPGFKRRHPRLAATYLRQARAAWSFLEAAWEEHGKRGAYQTISHYGDWRMDRDEIAWLATELFLATGEPQFHDYVRKAFDPNAPENRKWGWLRLHEAAGCAVRSYAFAAESGRIAPGSLSEPHLQASRRELRERSLDLGKWTLGSAYGVAFPFPSKAHRAVGWFFPMAMTVDLAFADADTDAERRRFDRAIVENVFYELGANPANVCYLAGLGCRRPLEMVHQWGLNDRESLPPSGLPVGSLRTGFRWNHRYESLPGTLTIPDDGDVRNPYPFYDRWSDAYDVSTEFVVPTLGKALAVALYQMAQTRHRETPWKPRAAQIVRENGRCSLVLPGGLDPADAMIVWEADTVGSPLTGPRVRIPGNAPLDLGRSAMAGRPASFRNLAPWNYPTITRKEALWSGRVDSRSPRCRAMSSRGSG